MSLFTMIFIVSFLGAIIGVKKPWMGGIPGLLMAPFLFYFSISSNIIPIIFNVLFLFILGLAYGFISSIIFSGLKGDGHNIGSIYILGFGAHHPGGIILSDEERKKLRDRNIKREVFISY
ncbi:MAG: hypothetical protein SWH54_06405 [Thermodesulfobacteriota bacterium]|nr:hypothetical protein [Thermodesulfobacteriota bacterium]